MKNLIVIGSGFAGLSAASFMAKAGWKVTVLEKHSQPGGRARQFKEAGFSFDMGPSWYWMPEVFERYFSQFGRSVSEFYSLKRLDPSYRVYTASESVDIPASYDELRALFERFEPGSAPKLDRFIKEAAYKYRVGMESLVYKPGLSATELLDWQVIRGMAKLDVFSSMKQHVQKYFRHPLLQQVMEFPVLFLGAMPERIPALYSLMNYADIVGGTWYPQGGMYSIVEGMYTLARELGVNFQFNCSANKIRVAGGKAEGVETENGFYRADAIIAAADYHHVEQVLLPEDHRSYSQSYWDKKQMAPGALLYYVGLNKKLEGVRHHSLFFDAPFHQHGKEIYEKPSWPSNPLFYASTPSVTDPSVAPGDCENLFLLIPVAAGLQDDSTEIREKYFDLIITRMEQKLGTAVRDAIIYRRSYSYTDFVGDYHSFKGNAYGLANTLMQTAVLKPRCRSRKVKNLFFAGQLTVPGPGVPPSLISGEVAARQVVKYFGK